MRVAVVHNLPPGGAWRRMRNQAVNLGSEVVEVCLATATPFSSRPVVIPLRRGSEQLPRALRPPARYFDQLALEVAWNRCTQRIRELRCDVVFLNPCRYLQAPPVTFGALPPVVYFCDEPRRIDNEPSAAAERNALTKPLYQPIYARERHLDQRTARTVDAIATNSHYTAGEIKRIYGRDAEVLRMGVAGFPPAAAPRTGEFVLSVGTLIPNKGHDLVVQAAAACATSRPVRVVAPRPAPAYQAQLEDLARSLGVELSVQVAVSDTELTELYRTAFATLYLARREPLGLVSLEAQAAGCPVIVAAEGGLPETIIDGVSGWKCPRNAQAATDLLDRLGAEGVRARMSDAARANASSWTWSQSASELSELLSRVVAGRSSD